MLNGTNSAIVSFMLASLLLMSISLPSQPTLRRPLCRFLSSFLFLFVFSFCFAFFGLTVNSLRSLCVFSLSRCPET